jgi:hypothetical protein
MCGQINASRPNSTAAMPRTKIAHQSRANIADIVSLYPVTIVVP